MYGIPQHQKNDPPKTRTRGAMTDIACDGWENTRLTQGHGNVCWKVILGKFQGGAFTPKAYTDAEAKKIDSHSDPTWSFKKW